MNTRDHRGQFTLRVMAALLACTMLSWAAPPNASADDFWGLWGREIKQRVWWEMPFAVAISLPAMVLTTPFWAGRNATRALMGMGGNDKGGNDKDDE